MNALGDRRRIDLFVPLRTLLLVAAVVAVLWAFVAVRDAFLAVFIGVFLALVFEFPVRWVTEKTRLPRGLAATVTVVGALLATVALGLVLLVPFVGAIRDFVKELPALLEELRNSGELGWMGDTGAAENVQVGANQVAAWIPETVGAVLGVAGSAAGSLVMVFTVVFTALFLLTDVGDLKRAVASVLMPEQETRWLDVWERITMSVSRWAIGVVVIALVAGLTQGLTAWLLGSSLALALGLIAGFLDMIPNIGATLAGVILTLALLAEEGLQAALIMLAVVLVYQQLENNLVTPTVQGKAVNVSGFVIIVAVALFGALMGVLGAIVAVPLAATIQIVVQELTVARREQVAAAKAAPVASP
jgi:predicted PurR-regulated permease PerM